MKFGVVCCLVIDCCDSVSFIMMVGRGRRLLLICLFELLLFAPVVIAYNTSEVQNNSSAHIMFTKSSNFVKIPITLAKTDKVNLDKIL